MKRKAIIPLVLGLVVGVFTVKLAVDAIKKAQASGKSTTTITAVRARQDIKPMEEITPEMVEIVETADSLFAPANERIESIKDVVGRVTSKGIPERTPILVSMLAPPGTKPGLLGKIKPGFRAVSVKIDEATSVGYQLKPGDWVDVIVVMDVATSVRGQKETIAEVILQHVQVGAIGHTTDSQQSSNQTGGKVKPAKSATILVPEEEVPKLHLAGTRGKITLAMRGEDDVTKSPRAIANMSDVMSQIMGKKTADAKKANASTPDKPIPDRKAGWLEPQLEPDPPHSVLVYHGAVGAKNQSFVEQITFETVESPVIVAVSAGMPSRSAMDSKAESRGRSRMTARTSDFAASKQGSSDKAGSDK